ncbi:MAG: hypothetical protein EBZ59_00160 [Planctomycetia bacterium]|nr:hypothetical protein [Planctomycetia bacterium]
MWRTVVAAAIVLSPAFAATVAMARPNPLLARVTLRVKVVSVEPEQPVLIAVQWGGRGLGGGVSNAAFAIREPDKPGLRGDLGDPRPDDDALDLPDELQEDPAAVQTVRDKATGKTYLKPGFWSWPNPMAGLNTGFIEFVVEGMGKPVAKLRLAFEFSVDGKVVRTFEERADAGNRVTIVVSREDPATPAWAESTMGIREYVERRADRLAALPWADMPTPRKITVLTDCGGYGTGFGGRHTSDEVLRAEARALGLIGVNSLRAGWDVIPVRVKDLPESTGGFTRAIEVHSGNGWQRLVPVVVDRQKEKVVAVPPGGGCPWYPPGVARAPEVARETLEHLVSHTGFEEVWALTIDEIGSVFNASPEGKPHMSSCPDCQAAFRKWLAGLGMKPADFDCGSWAEVRNIAYQGARPWAETNAEEKRIAREKLEALPGVKPGATPLGLSEPTTALDLGDELPASESPGAGAATGPASRGRAAAVPSAVKSDSDAAAVDLSDEEAAAAGPEAVAGEPRSGDAPTTPGRWRLAYWSDRFNCYSTANMFAELTRAIDAHNRAKQSAIDRGDTTSDIVKQPFVYSFALRGNTFLLGDASLDFFEFYRQADNAMVYETSNRDPRVWQWDSYLCDVGRSLQLNMGKRFGVYVKPHRGAPVQRSLAAVARGATNVFLYTYGPDYSKGDSFSSQDYHLANASKAMHLVGRAEDLVVGARFARPPEVAVVRDSTPSSAEWEDGKWVYTALQHSHVQVDALDQVMLATNDLGSYRVIYVTGSVIHRQSALALRSYVEKGGVLYTGAGGLSCDVAGQPIPELEEVLGVNGRKPAQLWCGPIRRYGATGLATFTAPGDPPGGHATIESQAGTLRPTVGHEPLVPRAGARVKATFADGSPALIENEFGRGRAYVSAIYGGLEYAARVHRPDFDMNADFDPTLRAWVAAPLEGRVSKAVDVSAAIVEALPLEQEASGRRSVVLMNWAYGPGKQLVPQENVKVTIADGRGVSRVVSRWTGAELSLERRGDAVVATLPRLEEGDVLALE